MTAHTLEADSMQLCYGDRRILSDVFLRCTTGTITGLLGRNGAGKSCLMQLIFGTREGERSVRVDGRYLPEAYRHPDRLRYLPQHHFVPGGMRVSAALKDFRVSETDFLATFSSFEGRLRERVRNLSGGQKRQLELFLIAGTATQFALLDEPFTHLNPIQVEEVVKWLKRVKETKGILLSDHMFRHVLDCSDTVFVLKDGKTHRVQKQSDLETLGYCRTADYE